MPQRITTSRVVSFAISPATKKGFKSNKSQENLLCNQPDYTYNGSLSKRAKRNIREKIELITLKKLVEKSMHRDRIKCNLQKLKRNMKSKKPLLSFITLTLSSEQQHDDNEIKRHCLQPFLAALKSLVNLKYYVWVSELQKNGNIHFHIITPTFITHQIIRNYWNWYQNRLGYVDRCKYSNPPSTEIRACKSVNSVSYYVTKYITKNNRNKSKPDIKMRKMNGRIWGCDTASEELLFLNYNDRDVEMLQLEINRACFLEIPGEHFTIWFYRITETDEIVRLLAERLLRIQLLPT